MVCVIASIVSFRLSLPFMSILILSCICYQFSMRVCTGTQCSSFWLQSEEPLYGSLPFHVLFLYYHPLLPLYLCFFSPPSILFTPGLFQISIFTTIAVLIIIIIYSRHKNINRWCCFIAVGTHVLQSLAQCFTCCNHFSYNMARAKSLSSWSSRLFSRVLRLK